MTFTLLAACGDPLVTDSYRGAPLWSYEGEAQRGANTPRGAVYRMALFFQPHLDTVDANEMIELTASGLDVPIPSSYVLNVYAPPPPEMFLKRADGTSLGYGAARILLYDDRDGDQRKGADEPFTGSTPPIAVLYVPHDVGPGETTSRGALAAGFHVAPLPQPCDYRPPPPTTPEDCGVPLGDPCDVDADCRGGSCLKESKQPWPTGYCVVAEPPANGCRPGAGQYVHAPRFSPTPPGWVGFYARRCTTDADCHRVRPKEQLYKCDPTWLACVPPIGGLVSVDPNLEIEPLCAGGPRAVPPPQ